MADCFWTDLVGVTQQCEAEPVIGYTLWKASSGQSPVVYSAGLGAAFWATPDYDSASVYALADGAEWSDQLVSFVGSTAGVAANSSLVVALGCMTPVGTTPYTVDAVASTDGVSITRYSDVIPLSNMPYVYGVVYHPGRAKFYALVGAGSQTQVYEMGATPADWTSVLTIASNPAAASGYLWSSITYLPGTQEIIVLAPLGGIVHAYSLGSAGGFIDHTLSGVSYVEAGNSESRPSVAYCAGVAKYVVMVPNMATDGYNAQRTLLAASSLDTTFSDTGLVGGDYSYGGYVLSDAASGSVMWGDWRFCDGNYASRVLASNDLLSVTPLFDSADWDPDSPAVQLAHGSASDLYGLIPGAAMGTGMLFVDTHKYCV